MHRLIFTVIKIIYAYIMPCTLKLWSNSNFYKLNVREGIHNGHDVEFIQKSNITFKTIVMHSWICIYYGCR